MKKIYIYLGLFFCFLGVGFAQTETEVAEAISRLNGANVLGGTVCPNTNENAFTGSSANNGFVNAKKINYVVTNYPALRTRHATDSIINEVMRSVSEQSGIEIERKDFSHDSSTSDLQITHEWIDGHGGVLGFAVTGNVPNHFGRVVIDNFDIQTLPNKEQTYDPYTIYLHETLHIFGLAHKADARSVMFARYLSSVSGIPIIDAIDLREKYDYKKSFSAGKHKYIYILQNDTRQLNFFFKRSEFASKCLKKDIETVDSGSWVDSTLIEAITFLREYYKTAIVITSSFRSSICNARVGGVRNSQHLLSNAIDFKFVGAKAATTSAKWSKDIESGGGAVRKLLELGVFGFGHYANGVFHIDTREMPKFGAVCNGYNYTAWRTFKGSSKLKYISNTGNDSQIEECN